MNPDPERYFNAEEVALQKAGIIAAGCKGSIEEAKANNIPGWHTADAYLDCLELEFYKKNYKIVAGSYFDDSIEQEEIIGTGRFNSFDLYIEKEYAIHWLPGDDDLRTIQSVTSASQHHPLPPVPQKNTASDKYEKPAAYSALLIISLFISELGFYKKYDEKGQKGGQFAATKHIQDLVETYLSSNKNLSESTIKETIRMAMIIFSERAI